MNEVTKKKEEDNIKVPVTEIQKRWQEAKYLAQSDLLPKHFSGKPANCLIALEYAKTTVLLITGTLARYR